MKLWTDPADLGYRVCVNLIGVLRDPRDGMTARWRLRLVEQALADLERHVSAPVDPGPPYCVARAELLDLLADLEADAAVGFADDRPAVRRAAARLLSRVDVVRTQVSRLQRALVAAPAPADDDPPAGDD